MAQLLQRILFPNLSKGIEAIKEALLRCVQAEKFPDVNSHVFSTFPKQVTEISMTRIVFSI